MAENEKIKESLVQIFETVSIFALKLEFVCIFWIFEYRGAARRNTGNPEIKKIVA